MMKNIVDKLEWDLVRHLLKGALKSEVSINERNFKNKEDGYFRIYLDGDNYEYIGVVLTAGGQVSSWEYKKINYSYCNMIITETYEHKGENRQLVNFLEHVFNSLKTEGRHDNEIRLRDLLNNRF